MEFTIQSGDLVQARMMTAEGVAVTEFTVTSIEGGTFTGSPLGALSVGDGWSFELCRKGDPGLPVVFSMLAAWLVQDRSVPVKIIGPDEGIWREPSGARVYPQDVLAWVPWGDHTSDAV